MRRQDLPPIVFERAPVTPLPEVTELFGYDAERAWKLAHRIFAKDNPHADFQETQPLLQERGWSDAR